MLFKKVITVKLDDYNSNKAVDGYLPQNGSVINVFYNTNLFTEFVAVGFAE